MVLGQAKDPYKLKTGDILVSGHAYSVSNISQDAGGDQDYLAIGDSAGADPTRANAHAAASIAQNKDGDHFTTGDSQMATFLAGKDSAGVAQMQVFANQKRQ